MCARRRGGRAVEEDGPDGPSRLRPTRSEAPVVFLIFVFGILNNERFPLKSVATRAYYKNARRYVKTAAIDSAFFIHHFLYQLLILIPPIPLSPPQDGGRAINRGSKGWGGANKRARGVAGDEGLVLSWRQSRGGAKAFGCFCLAHSDK